MASIVDEIIKGRKVFFIAPDHSLLPQSYLEEYLTLGYECYFIDNDIFLPLETKVEIILSIFKDSILFFNIDAPISTIKWPSFIQTLQMKYSEAIFGVLFNKRQAIAERQGIERQFLYTIGIKGGCIQLEYQKKNNFGLVEKVLFANQAMGRRKNVRAVCSSGCSFQLVTDRNEVISGKLNDISISHFSFTLDQNALSLNEYEKVSDIAFSVRGLHFRSDAVLYMMRDTDVGILFVFAFTMGNGQSGLESASRQLLIPKLYEIMAGNCNELLSKLFKAAGQKRDNEIPELGSLD